MLLPSVPPPPGHIIRSFYTVTMFPHAIPMHVVRALSWMRSCPHRVRTVPEAPSLPTSFWYPAVCSSLTAHRIKFPHYFRQVCV